MSMLTSHFSSLVMTPAIVKKLMGFRVNPTDAAAANGSVALCSDNASACSSSGSNGSLKMATSSTSTAATNSSSNMVSLSAANMSNHNKLCEKAIRALVKKLKKTPGALDELERAITTRDPNTKCITIPLKATPQQDRISRKALPHVVYCRIWRFPDLQNCNELKSLPNCQHGYSHHHHHGHVNAMSANGKRGGVDDSAIICINPYHYTRCEQNQQPSNLSSNIGMDSSQSAVKPSLLTVYVPKPKDSQMMVDPTPPMPVGHAQVQNGAAALKSEIPAQQQQQQQQLSMTSDLIHSSNFMIAASPSPISTPSPPLMTNNGNGYNNGGSTNGSTSNNSNNSAVASNSYFNINSPLSPPTSSSSPPNLANYNMSLSRSPPSIAMLQQFSPFLSEDDSSEINDISPSPICDLMPVVMAEQPYWCSMSYYEMKQRVGEMFHVASNVHAVTIDGYTDPSSASRFCLGVLSNANRTEEIEMTRRYIGRGVTLHYQNGQVHAECLSENPVFVQSANCNQRYNWHLATVIKIPPGCSLKIFDEAAFVQLANETVYQGFEAVYALTRICSIRISFVKGWGESYRRQTVLNTPCWIELHLNNPLKLVDEVLTKMGSPRTKCTSVS